MIMVLKLESQRCVDLVSSTYRQLLKFKLLFPLTRCLLHAPATTMAWSSVSEFAGGS
jgi:hypothetical protein